MYGLFTSFAYGFVRVWNLVPYIKGGTKTEVHNHRVSGLGDKRSVSDTAAPLHAGVWGSGGIAASILNSDTISRFCRLHAAAALILCRRLRGHQTEPVVPARNGTPIPGSYSPEPSRCTEEPRRWAYLFADVTEVNLGKRETAFGDAT